MYAVSEDYHEHMQGRKRHVLAKVIVDYTDPLIDQGIEITANEQARISWPGQTADSLTQIPYLWARLDGSWLLDGEKHFMPGSEKSARMYQMGWWGSSAAAGDGSFSVPYPVLSVSHTPRPVQSLRVVGESMLGEYPVNFTIRLFDDANQQLYQKVVSGNDQLDWKMVLDDPVLDVARQDLEITAWSEPGTVVKIAEFYTSIQETYMDEDLISVRLLEERETSQGSLPVGNISSNEISVTFLNADHRFDPDNDASPLYRLVRPRRRINAWLGYDDDGEEWVPLGVFWAIDWEITNEALEASVIARDRLELLRLSTYEMDQVGDDISLYDMTVDVLDDAGLRPSEYYVDPALQDIIIPVGWLPPMSHREALRIIAEAGMAVAYADRDGRIRMVVPSFAGAPGDGYEIGPDDYFLPVRMPTRQEMTANEITVVTQPLETAETEEEVYRGYVLLQAYETRTITVQYTSRPIMDPVATMTGVLLNITDTVTYAWGMDVTIENPRDGSAFGYLIIEGRSVSVVGTERITASDITSIRAHGILRYEMPENPLVQTRDHAELIAQGLLDIVKEPTRDIEFEWHGNPAVELGDAISVVSEQDRRSDYVITRQEIQWAGALRTKLTGRSVEG